MAELLSWRERLDFAACTLIVVLLIVVHAVHGWMQMEERVPLLRKDGAAAGCSLAHAIDIKRRAPGRRSWIRIDTCGNTQALEIDKLGVMRRCHLPGRDLRLLDPLFVYPSTILGREKAIVVNLEQIRCVITADEVLLLNSANSYVLQFVSELQHRVAPEKHARASAFRWRSPGSQKIDIDRYELSALCANSENSSNSADHYDGLSVNNLPFEFKALEVSLEIVCVVLDSQTSELEDEAYPLLEQLASKINTLNLERVRRLKSRLAALRSRVEKVRDEVEQLMDDDEDMAELYLTDKKERAMMANAVSFSAPVSPIGSPTRFSSSLEKSHSIGWTKHEGKVDNVEKVEELEMLLEAYFVVVDGIFNKLTSLEEYVENTEDLINIHLDNVRNQLIQFELILTTATFVMAFYGIVAGAFGMNVPVPFSDKPWAFKWVLAVAGIVSVVMFASVLLFLRWRKLIPL